MNSTTLVYRDAVEAAVIKNVLIVVLCVAINYVNSILVHTFRKHQVFSSNPRYVFFIHLVINDILLLTAFTLLQVLSYIVFTLNASLCIVLLVIGVSTNLNNPLTLAVMSVECYLAICFPLRHTQICTVRKSYVVIGLIWTLSSLSILPDLFVAVATESVDFFRSRVFCLRVNAFRPQFLTVKRDASNTVFLVLVWFTLFYTYFRILFTAKAAAADAKKARNTVLLHSFQLVLCMLSYVFDLLLEGLTFLFPNNVLTIRFTLSIVIHILPRLISPAVYGLRDKIFRKYLKRNFSCTTKTKIHP